MDRPPTRFAWNGEVSLAYQVCGVGASDLVYLQGYSSNVDMNWESPYLSRFLRGLAAHARLIVTDRRGWGCSERFTPRHVPDVDTLTDDILAVMKAARSERASIRSVLPSIHVPTLVLVDSDRFYEVLPETGHLVASKIPAARVVEHSSRGGPHFHWYGRGEAIVTEVRRFLAEIGEEEASFDRILATVLFTDIVDSTRRAADLGDRRWRELVLRHHATVRSLLARYRGVEIDTAGDGFFASFDGPARAVRCAMAIVDAVRPLGIEVRAGLHTGEVERMGDKVGGLAVNIGARVAALAAPSEVLVSQTVRDLMVGSGLSLTDRGSHGLKGVPGLWGLYAVRREGERGAADALTAPA